MLNRAETITEAIDLLESGRTAHPDPVTAADTLREQSRGGSGQRFAAYKQAQRILVDAQRSASCYDEDEELIAEHVRTCNADGFCYVCQCL